MKTISVLLSVFLIAPSVLAEAKKPVDHKRKPSSTSFWVYECQYSPKASRERGEFVWYYVGNMSMNAYPQMDGTCVSPNASDFCPAAVSRDGSTPMPCNKEDIAKLIGAKGF